MNKTFKTLRKVLFTLILILIIFTISGYIYLYILPKGPEITETRTLKNESDSFVMYAL